MQRVRDVCGLMEGVQGMSHKKLRSLQDEQRMLDQNIRVLEHSSPKHIVCLFYHPSQCIAWNKLPHQETPHPKEDRPRFLAMEEG